MDPNLVEGEAAEKRYQNQEASGKSAAAQAKKEDKKKFEDAVLVVATLITTLTYQALLNPPSSLYNQGTKIHWGCIGKHPGRGLIKGMKDCPAGLTFAFLFINTTIFVNSILIVVLTLPRRRRIFNPFGSLLGGLAVNLTVTYCILLMAFSYYTAYVAIPLCVVAFLVLSVVMMCGGIVSKIKLFIQLAEEDPRRAADAEEAMSEFAEEIIDMIETVQKGYIKPKKEFESAILVLATLIITLTYQGLLNPPSTLFKQGTEIDWRCLGKHHRHGLIEGMKECPAGLAFAFLFFNTSTFLNSILLVARILQGRRGFLLGALIIFLMVCYCILVMAFSYNTAYVAIPLCCLAFLQCLPSLKTSLTKNK